MKLCTPFGGKQFDPPANHDVELNFEAMTDKQSDFQAVLRLAGIEINETDIPLVFELAKACEKCKEIDLRQYAKVFAEHASHERKAMLARAKTLPKPQSERQYTELKISKNCKPNYPMAC